MQEDRRDRLRVQWDTLSLLRPQDIDEGAAYDGKEIESGLMKVTTSRDPSAKARRLGKRLARFLSLPYVNRGKMGLCDEEIWLVVVEDHGNPTGLVKRTAEGEELLCFTPVSPDHQKRQRRRLHPIVIGRKEEAEHIARFFELDYSADSLASHERTILATSERIDFVDADEIVLRLRI
jgi:hypothetical protein